MTRLHDTTQTNNPPPSSPLSSTRGLQKNCELDDTVKLRTVSYHDAVTPPDMCVYATCDSPPLRLRRPFGPPCPLETLTLNHLPQSHRPIPNNRDDRTVPTVVVPTVVVSDHEGDDEDDFVTSRRFSVVRVASKGLFRRVSRLSIPVAPFVVSCCCTVHRPDTRSRQRLTLW
jgi:hypothetical protein